jgi:hypothetical protein
VAASAPAVGEDGAVKPAVLVQAPVTGGQAPAKADAAANR